VGNGGTVVGGDFNYKGTDVDGKIEGSGIIRSQHTDGGYTFKSDIGDEHRGKTIDHVLSRGYPCKSWVSQNGRFLSDHIPIVAEMHNGIEERGRKDDRQHGNTQH
jgi:endonuclease/exonuclease/phosphatase family metal-dependent hydrolase